MDRRIFETYIKTQLAPTLQPGDVVILDNLPAHKSAAAEAAIRAKGAWLLFLPPYSPDLNPIEMAFAKLKALLRARAIRTIDALWRAIAYRAGKIGAKGGEPHLDGRRVKASIERRVGEGIHPDDQTAMLAEPDCGFQRDGTAHGMTDDRDTVRARCRAL
jgi:hypothetical protein